MMTINNWLNPLVLVVEGISQLKEVFLIKIFST